MGSSFQLINNNISFASLCDKHGLRTNQTYLKKMLWCKALKLTNSDFHDISMVWGWVICDTTTSFIGWKAGKYLVITLPTSMARSDVNWFCTDAVGRSWWSGRSSKLQHGPFSAKLGEQTTRSLIAYWFVQWIDWLEDCLVCILDLMLRSKLSATILLK